MARADRSAEDIATARQLYNEAIALRDRGELVAALAKFKAAHALGKTPVTGFELCRAHVAIHQPIEAREACLSVARLEVSREESTRSAEARVRAAELAEQQKTRIGAIRVRLPGASRLSRVTVAIVGSKLPEEALTEPRAVNPGGHTITVEAASQRTIEARVEVGEGEIKEVDLEAPKDEPESPPVESEGARHSRPMAPFATASFVVAGVAAAGGLSMGARAFFLAQSLDGDCARNLCGRERWADLDAAKSAGTASTGLFVLAAVALGTGLYMQFTRNAGAPSAAAKVTAAIGSEGAVLRGSF